MQVMAGMMDNITRTVTELSEEIGRRSAEQIRVQWEQDPGGRIQLGRLIANQAQLVLLDWFLGRDSVERSSESRELSAKGRDNGD